jgi:hypothetical protein
MSHAEHVPDGMLRGKLIPPGMTDTGRDYHWDVRPSRYVPREEVSIPVATRDIKEQPDRPLDFTARWHAERGSKPETRPAQVEKLVNDESLDWARARSRAVALAKGRRPAPDALGPKLEAILEQRYPAWLDVTDLIRALVEAQPEKFHQYSKHPSRTQIGQAMISGRRAGRVSVRKKTTTSKEVEYRFNPREQLEAAA